MVSKEEVTAVLKTVDDPEIGVNIIDLGLVYDIKIGDDSKVAIVMTLTTPMCPLGPMIEEEVRKKLAAAGVENISLEFVLEPAWDPSKMSEEAKLQLGYQG